LWSHGDAVEIHGWSIGVSGVVVGVDQLGKSVQVGGHVGIRDAGPLFAWLAAEDVVDAIANSGEQEHRVVDLVRSCRHVRDGQGVSKRIVVTAGLAACEWLAAQRLDEELAPGAVRCRFAGWLPGG
jgi:hypothetical protein